jgi:VCBS repeat-containing protein
VDGDLLAARVVSQPGHGTVLLSPNGRLAYTPSADFHGTDTFTYTVFDGFTDSNTATVTIVVTPVNDAPRAVADTYTTDEDVELVIALPGVLSNDTDADSDPLTAGILGLPSHGTLTFSSDGSFRYMPDENFNGTDTFTYQVDDGQSATKPSATVTLTVNPVNDPPAVQPDQGTTNEGQPMTFVAAQLLGNDLGGPIGPAGTADNEQSQTLAVIGVSSQSAAGGTVVLGAGLITYTPPAYFYGTDTVTYLVGDNGLPASAQATGTLTIMVLSVNDKPSGVDDHYTVAENAALNVAAPGLLVNDIDPDHDPLTATVQTLVTAAGAAVQIHQDGSFQYDPTGSFELRALNAGQTRQDTFAYQLSDGDEGTASATVTITVTGITDPPFQNPVNPFDVNADGNVSALDPLLIINHINRYGAGSLSPPADGEGPASRPAPMWFPDVSGDGAVTAQDVLNIINKLNSQAAGESSGGEGEGSLSELFAPVIVDHRIAENRLAGPADRLTDRMTAPVQRPDPRKVESVHSPSNSIFDDLELDSWNLGDDLAEIVEAADAAAGEDAVDLLFASF